MVAFGRGQSETRTASRFAWLFLGRQLGGDSFHRLPILRAHRTQREIRGIQANRLSMKKRLFLVIEDVIIRESLSTDMVGSMGMSAHKAPVSAIPVGRVGNPVEGEHDSGLKLNAIPL